MIQTRKEMKHELQKSCHGVLRDLLEEVGFNDEERIVFTERYLHEHSVFYICLMLPCGNNKYNRIHNRILDKVRSHYNRIFMTQNS